MAEQSWFKHDSDSDDSGSEDETTDSSSESSGSSGSSSSSSSSDSSSEVGDGEAPGLKGWLKGGKGRDSDSDDVGKKNKVLSKRDKEFDAREKLKKMVIDHLSNKDYSSLIDDLDALTKKNAGGTPDQFISVLKRFKEFWESSPPKPQKNFKHFNALKQKTKKLMTQYADQIAGYESEGSESSTESSDDFDSDMSDDVVKKPQKQKQKKPQGKKADVKKEEKKKEEEDWTEEGIEKKIEAIKAERGKKVTKNATLIEKLKVILSHCGSWKHMALYVLNTLLSCQLDTSGGQRIQPLSQAAWRACYETFTRMMNIIQENPNITAVDQDLTDDRRDRRGNYEQDGDKYKVYLTCCCFQVVEALGDDYTRALQFTDPHSQDYINRLSDEGFLIDLAERVHVHYKQAGKFDIASRMAIRLMEHLYYRRHMDHEIMMQQQRDQTFPKAGEKLQIHVPEKPVEKDSDDEDAEKPDEDAPLSAAAQAAANINQMLDQRAKKTKYWIVSENLAEVIKFLHKYIYKHSLDEKNKTKALLFYIYHLALHDQYNKARDLLLMSRRNAEHDDHMRFVNSTNLMIIYNRVIAQLGLAAFRAGELFDTNVILNEISSHIREYLAQTLVKAMTREKPETEQRAEKEKLIPFHMHINVDMLEGAHLIAALLLEVPIRAQYPHDTKRRPHSKAFTRLLSSFTQQVFLGPPETTKELIYAAFLELQKGNWEKTNELIMSLSMWNLIREPEKVQKIITEEIKIVGLRTYLFTYSQYYATVQLGELATKYQLEESKVHATISRMILKQQITAAWDQPQQCICVEQNSVSKLQFLASLIADKCGMLAEYNDKRLHDDKESRGGRDAGGYDRNYSHKRRQGGNRWDNRGNSHRLGLQKSREVERKKDTNPFERRVWNRGKQ